MAKNGGLGRGLDALLTDYVSAEPAGVKQLSIYEIDTNVNQPRKSFDETALKELADSIRRHGVVQPILVQKKGERFLIVAGERRYRAARMAGLQEVPVLVVQYDEEKLHEISLIENIQREDLNPVEEAAALKYLMDQYDLTQEELSARIGKSRPAIANALRLLKLDEGALDALKSGALSAAHGRLLAGVPDAALQQSLCKRCQSEGWSVRQLEERIKQQGASRAAKKAAPALSNDLRSAQDLFMRRLQTKVRISGDEQKGRIVIDYFDHATLERLYEALSGQERE